MTHLDATLTCFFSFVQVHVGTQNVNSQMESYIYDRTRDGVFYLDLAKTWEKTMVAARIIAAIQEYNRKDVLVSSAIAQQVPFLRAAVLELRHALADGALVLSRLVADFSILPGRLPAPLCPESHSQVRHVHRRQLHGRQVGPRNAD